MTDKPDRDLPFIVRAMSGLNVAMSEDLSGKMTDAEREQVITAYQEKSGRQILAKIRQRIAQESQEVIDITDTDVVTDDEF